MSTPCLIGITSKNEPYNSKIRSIYCHWDGDTDYMVPILTTSYNSKEKAEALIALGSISSLGNKIAPTGDNHTFDHPEDDTTVAYVRDRGEEWDDNKPLDYDTKREFATHFDYGYIFDIDSNQWLIYQYGRRKNN